MRSDNPTRQVLIALMLTASLLIIAGDRWSERINRFKPVAPASKGNA